MKPSTPLKRKTPLKSQGFARADRIEAREVSKLQRKAPARKATMKTKQRAVTTEEKAFWDRLAGLGCIACMKDGVYQPVVSIHHVDGRTKPGCHKLVLPLCAGHHQDGTGEDKSLIAVHPWKARFEKTYGTQEELMAECAQLLETAK
ncbi:Ref family recombination enhancement nuclease [Pseudoduganella sp. UC29_106]|uniref:Ref family recombination enhancement nuclease n=1 Tax=Pseudoduganella sp. UC29_106 TaxID=3374553 RepID=UPI00375809F9